MKDLIGSYYKEFRVLLDAVTAAGSENRKMEFFQGIEKTCKLVKEQSADGGKMVFVGNGGSAAIAGHMAIDFWKNGLMKAISFNDGPLLTCISNDFGYEHVFEKPFEMFAEQRDVLFAISSSGRSENILNCVRAAHAMGCRVVTLSGFDPDNPLSRLGEINFHVPSHEYGPVEVIHQYVVHFILDVIINERLRSEKLAEAI